jgi:two-component sensor histidine kinase
MFHAATPHSHAQRCLRLQSHLVLLVLAVLIPLVLFCAIMILLFASQERRTAERGMRETTRALALAVDNEVATMTAVLAVLSTSSTLGSNDLAGFYQRCLEARQFVPSGAEIDLSDLQGQRLLDTRVPFGSPLPMVANTEMLQRVVKTGRPSTSDLFIGAVAKQPIIAISVPVWHDGQVRYVLRLTLPAHTLGNIFVAQRLPPGWLGGINDRKQVILATTPGLERFIGEPVTPRMAERSAVAEEDWFPNVAKDGTGVYSAFSRIRSTGWTMALNAPADGIDAPRRHSLTLVLSGGLVLGALALWIALRLGRRAVAPIRELVAAAQTLGQGHPMTLAPLGPVREVQDVSEALTEAASLLRQREAALQEAIQIREVLLKEIHHRVKNNLQVIASLLALQSDTIKASEELALFHESQDRVRSMALIHETLYQSSNLARCNFAHYLDTLAAHLLQSYGVQPQRIGLHIDAEDVLLDIDTAIPYGLILNELLSNALKYAFPNGRKGEIAIVLHAAPDSLTLSIRDTGVGFPAGLDFRHTDSLG